jgi:hypothetical protein
MRPNEAPQALPASERLFDGQGGRAFKKGGGKHCQAIEIFYAHQPGNLVASDDDAIVRGGGHR